MYIVYFSIGQEWPNNSFHLIRHLSHYYEQIEANITQNYPTKTSWPPWWPHLSQRDVFKTWEWQFDKRTVVNISRIFKAVSNLLGTNAKVGKYHRWNGENRRSLLSQNVLPMEGQEQQYQRLLLWPCSGIEVMKSGRFLEWKEYSDSYLPVH